MVTFRKLGQLGRWGNQLFQYAGVRLYAEKNKFSLAMPAWTGVLIFKDVTTWTADQEKQANQLVTLTLSDMGSMSGIERILSLLPGWKLKRISVRSLYEHPRDDIDLYGYFQEPYALDRLKENRQDIKHFFQLKEEVRAELEKATAHLAPWIGIHIRRGDFVKRNLAMPVKPYLEYLRSHGPQAIYLSSDDENIKKDFAEFSLIEIKNPTSLPDFIFDFWMLMKADSVLGCGSTFSWWAAFLSDSGKYFSPALTHLRTNNNPTTWQLNDESFS